ncbi:hypothetical protein BpHYR1_052339 [Brachionus plicatilis]|uniref:Uncharacterized protein n=1 Tax=Brachionus plicatilis TaxID=10195 RepID=A0A3M7S017_BRAPC|nr:hypothetical protein BpHYR1_052339 [Brachionus plicatilis]
MGLGAEAAVHVHAHGVELFERGERAEQDEDEAAALNCFDGARQQVGGERLEVLQHQHAVCVAEDFVRLVVVAVSDVGGGDEELERVVVVHVQFAAFDFFLDLFHALFAVRRKAELFFVAPEHVGPGLDLRFGQHVMQDDALVARLVADHHEHRAVLGRDAVLDQRSDPI